MEASENFMFKKESVFNYIMIPKSDVTTDNWPLYSKTDISGEQEAKVYMSSRNNKMREILHKSFHGISLESKDKVIKQ